jgi:hypothetical protein
MKKCRICKKEFSPFLSTAVVCSPRCALDYTRKKASAAADKAFNIKKRKFNANDVKKRKKVAQAAFNAYIRKRDEKLPCISCNRHHSGQYHAGHFKTTAARPDLKFNEDNCHKQCSACNNHLSGNIENYRPNLIEKIGRKRFDLLELDQVVRYLASDYKVIELKYKEMLKDML